MSEYKPPFWQNLDTSQPMVFLAGSIEMGKAKKWQDEYISEMTNLVTEVHLMNPRRDDWDSSWVQSIDNFYFKQQVDWELKYLERCDFAVMYLAADTISPISLLELGLFKHKMIVFCEEGFQRKGNVDIICDRYNVKQVSSMPELVQESKYRIHKIWKHKRG